jgi:hypothetical protein
MKNILRNSNFGFKNRIMRVALLRSEPRKLNRNFGGLRLSLALVLTAGWIGAAPTVFGQTTVTVGGGATVTSPATPTATWTTPPSGVTFGNWSRGSGVSWATAADALSGSGFNSASASVGYAANKFYKVTITAGLNTPFSLAGATWLTALSGSGSICSFAIYYSNNGGTLTQFGSTGTSTSSNSFTGSVAVAAGTSIDIYMIPFSASSSSTTVRWRNGSTFTLTATPTITGTATAAAFTTTYGTASTAQSFSVSGSNLTANLVATAPTGFEVSANGTTYGNTATFTPSSGSASGTLGIRLKANATVSGSYNSQNIVLSSTGATSVNITTAASGNVVSKATPSLIITSANSATEGGSVSLTASSAAASGAVSASTGAITYFSSDTGVVSISSTTANAVAAGTATITATQDADSNYNQAEATQSFTVNALSGTITPSTTSLSAFADTPYGTSSTASSFTVSGSGLTGNLTVAASSGFEVSTSEGGGYATSLTLTATDGSLDSTAIYVRLAATTAAGSYSGNINISGGSASAQTVSIGSSTVTKADQASVTGSFVASTITFGQTASVTGSGGSGTGAYELRSIGGSGAVTFTGTTINVTTPGTADIEIRRLGDTNYNASGWVSVGTLTINKASQTITGVATTMTKTFGDAAYSLGASVGSGLTLSYASDNTAVARVSSAGLVTIVGGGSANITASQAGNDNYNAATPVPQALTVNKANQTITFGTLASKTTADAPFALTGTTTAAGLTVSYTSSNPSVATVLENTVTIIGVGTTTITASQPGNDNYNAATSVARSLSVTRVLSLTEIFVPQTIQGGLSTNAKRTPYIFRATLNGLLPNATYRYFTGAVISSDTATSSGAGLPIFIGTSGNFSRATTGTLSTAGSYAEFTTGPDGAFTGWFGLEPSGNARFATAGNSLQFRITLNDGNNGTASASFLTTPSSATVTAYATTGSNSGTGIWGLSAASAQNFVLLYDNVTGTGRPVAGAIIESDGVDNITNYPGFYSGNVNGVAGAWGTIIPNSLANGIRRIENRSRDAGSLVAANTDADGVWPSGANTLNPSGGDATVVALGINDARLAPAITSTGTLSALSTTYGIASSSASFSLEGLNLVAGVTVTPPPGFQVSTMSDFSLNFGDASVPLVVGASGAINATPVYVRLKADAAPGIYSGNIVLSSTSATSVNVATATSTVTNSAGNPLETYLAFYGLEKGTPEAAGTADPDGDGLNNAGEFAFGTSPVDGSSRAVTQESVVGGIKIKWLQRSEFTYTVKSTDNLGSAFSGTVSSSPVSPQPSGLGDYQQYEATLTGGDRGFLKVEAVVP